MDKTTILNRWKTILFALAATAAAARAIFERVIESYPESDVAASARWMLSDLSDTSRTELGGKRYDPVSSASVGAPASGVGSIRPGS